MKKLLRVLIIDDSDDDTMLLLRELKRGGYDIKHQRVETSESMNKALKKQQWDIIIADYALTDFNGFDALKLMQQNNIDLPFIIVSGKIGDDIAVEAMRAGAQDYIIKGNLSRLVPAIERELNDVELRREQKKATYEIQKQAWQWYATFNAIKDGICILDLKGKVMRCNSTMGKLLNKSIEEITDNYFWELFLGRSEPSEDCPFKRMLNSHKREVKELRKGDKWYKISTDPLLDDSGDTIGGVHIISDITERKNIENELRTTKNLLQSVIDSSASIIYLLDTEGRFLFVNKKLESLLGTTSDQIYGKTREDLLPLEIALRHRNNDLKVIRTGKPMSFEEKNLEKNGKHVYFSVKFPVTNINGNIYAVGGISTDITEHLKLESDIRELNAQLEQKVQERTTELETRKEELEMNHRALLNLVEELNNTSSELKRSNARLKELDRMKSLFIASTSHELRTPLNAIIGFSGVLLEGWSGELNKEQKDQIELILSSGQALLALVNDIIDISRVDSRKIETEKNEFDLKDVVDEAIKTIELDLKLKGLSLEVDVPSMPLSTDRKRLLQCILNLLSNAIKFTEQGMISIKAEKIKNKLTISVMDTGIGISENDMIKLFRPFVRLETHLSSKTKGTGLGLYLVNKLVQDTLGGTVEVKSTEGKGSTFCMILPLSGNKSTSHKISDEEGLE